MRPFTLGADLHGYNVQVPGEGVEDERNANPFGLRAVQLTVAMSELLALGLTLEETVATVTANPAKLLKMEDEIGGKVGADGRHQCRRNSEWPFQAFR